jgi:hypothetical protein
VTFSIYGFKATFNYENCLNKWVWLSRGNLDLKWGATFQSSELKGWLGSWMHRRQGHRQWGPQGWVPFQAPATSTTTQGPLG